MKSINVFVETGKKKVFMGAVDWPGWSRSGRDEQAALISLKEYGLRYAQILDQAEIVFHGLTDETEFKITERHMGNATTDFGAPSILLDADREPIGEPEYQRLRKIMLSSWLKFDKVVEGAQGRELRTGPRGGGRDLVKMLNHVNEAEQMYLKRLAWKGKKYTVEEMDKTRHDILRAFEVAIHEGLPEKGPRGGAIWKPRYFVRRVVWHILDHTWEIEDRIL